jgi:hypothetical protein
MKVELCDIGKIRINDKNPRHIKVDQFEKLKKSIQDFPEMMKLRPIVVDENFIALGGNQRLAACISLGMEKVWICKAENLSEKEKKEFVLKDNKSYGEWDNVALAELFPEDLLFELDLMVSGADEKVKDVSCDDSNCLYPLIPKYDEKHELFVIISDSEMDSNNLREKLKMQNMISYKNGKILRSNVISIKDALNAIEDYNPKS